MNGKQSAQNEDESSPAEPPIVTQPSSSGRRQRATGTHTGAFGQRTGHSDLVFLEGILPTEGNRTRSDDPIDAQTERCLDRLEAVLAGYGLGLEDVMRVRVQLTDIESRDVVDQVYEARFDGEYPPRTTSGVCELPGGAGVQLEVVAADE
jgi:2-iminobutanoate/2-iminopropanoate deaminase